MQDEIHNKYMKTSFLPPAKRIGVNICDNNPDLIIFCQNILTAKSYYRPDYQQFNEVFKNMIDEVTIKNISPRAAIQNAKELLQYNLY
jgi:hypothetical protein